ncbi:ATP-binding protein [Cystobacter fuscus]|uniref:ATP-binding protein n=1 Tax=Cystobacter fuscus TaxID=43 RepID=UPI0037C0B1FB
MKFLFNPGLPGQLAFELTEGSVLIGRTHECDVYIPHKSLSRQHARLECSEGRVTLVDLASKNGSFVNGVRIERCDIQPGDDIQLGEVPLAFLPNDLSSAATHAPAGLSPYDNAGESLDAAMLKPTLVRDLSKITVQAVLQQALAAGESEKAQRAQERLRALLNASQLLSSPRDLQVLLGEILDLAFRILGVDRAAILLVNSSTGVLEPKIVKSANAAIPAAYSQQIVDYVHAHGVSAVFTDAVSDPRLGASVSVALQSIHASVCIPLRPKKEVLGVFYVDSLSATGLFGSDDLEFLAVFANQAAMAIENSMLYRRIEEETVSRMQLIMDAKLASLSALVAGIAHELKNPLHFINNFALLSTELTDDLAAGLQLRGDGTAAALVKNAEDSLEMLRDSLQRIVGQGRRATNILNDMLRHGSSGAGAREKVDLNTVVAESIKLAVPRLQGFENSLHLDTTYDGSIGSVEVLRIGLCRAFLNIIENACDAMSKKRRELGPSYTPQLRIHTIARENHVEIQIRDNGHGIPPEIAEKIYNPFFTTKPPGEGTGLGLSLSHDIIVQGHQGTLQMNSIPGEFTEFIISLPRKPSPSTKAS